MPNSMALEAREVGYRIAGQPDTFASAVRALAWRKIQRPTSGQQLATYCDPVVGDLDVMVIDFTTSEILADLQEKNVTARRVRQAERYWIGHQRESFNWREPGEMGKATSTSCGRIRSGVEHQPAMPYAEVPAFAPR